jgi:hypothetical protein
MNPSKNKTFHTSHRGSRSMISLVLVTLGVVIAALAIFFAVRNANPPRRGAAPGAPKIAADKYKIDFGSQHFNHTVTAEFTLTNTGSGSLKISQAPSVEVKEGC